MGLKGLELGLGVEGRGLGVGLALGSFRQQCQSHGRAWGFKPSGCLPIPMRMVIRLQFGNGNGNEWERPWERQQMGRGMTHLPMGKNSHAFFIVVDLQ